MSLTLVSFAVFLLNRLLGIAGIQAVSDSEFLTTVRVIVDFVSALGVWWGRYRLGDITWYGRKLHPGE